MLQIWDIGGQSIGSKMLPNYIHGSHAVLFCYDITNYDSFANLEDWYRKVHGTYSKASGPMPCMALLGNKIDLSHMRAVRHDHHNRFADENQMHSYMLSAKNGDQVGRQKLRLPLQAQCAKTQLTRVIKPTCRSTRAFFGLRHSLQG